MFFMDYFFLAVWHIYFSTTETLIHLSEIQTRWFELEEKLYNGGSKSFPVCLDLLLGF